MGLAQYLKETQSELRHVAWPSRTQTIIYTVLVALISVGVALYLGFFDYLFTSGLARFVQAFPPATPVEQVQPAATSTPTSGNASTTQSGPTFKL